MPVRSNVLRGLSLSCIVALMFSALAMPVAHAQTVTTIVNFNDTNGATPLFVAPTQGRDGKLYGTTYDGGANSLGALVHITNLTTGNGTVLHSFAGTDGANPGGGVTLATDGNYYGTTVFGGTANVGVLYKYATGTGTFSVLHQFTGGPDGSYPYGPPIEASDGNLYGVTSGGNVDNSTLYKLTQAGVYSVIYTFDPATTGKIVYGPLYQGSDSNLYATANTGGSIGYGTLVKLTTAGVVKGTINFNGSNGQAPIGPVTQAADGTYYGTTQNGGMYSNGTIFSLGTKGGISVVHSFGGTGDGLNPEAGLVLGTDGKLYGTTITGSLFDYGSGTYTQLYAFTNSPSLVGGLAQFTSGKFYGFAQLAGTHSDGFLYSLDMGLGPFVSFVRPSGKAGATAQILGQGLTGTTAVTFNGLAATSFNVVTDTYMTAVVPTGATTGPLVVTTPTGTLTSNVSFRIVK